MTPRKTAAAFLAILMIAQVAIAQTQTILTVPAGGTYVLTIGQDGAKSLSGPYTVVTPGGIVVPPTTPPTDPPTTPPTDPISLTSLTTVSAAEYAKIPAGTSKQVMGLTVSTVYRKIASDLRDGSINVAQAAEHLSSIRTALPDEWAAWRTETSKAWNTLQDKGLITSAVTWAAASDAVADGVSPQGALESFVYDEDEFLDNPFVSTLIDMLIDLLGKTNSPIGKWLPLILTIVKLFAGGF
jgi:hypothetical protein